MRPPYGVHELNPNPQIDPGPPLRVRCYVAGCQHWVRPPSKEHAGEVCPTHGVYCHHSSSGVTLSYHDPRRNLLTDQDLFMRRVRHNPHKVESHRFGLINSEDAATWSVFRSLQNAGLLHLVAGAITGTPPSTEPQLWLWGLSSCDDKFQPWNLLDMARRRFEIGKLPVERPLSEFDIALYIPNELVLVIEAKLLAENPCAYPGRPRATPQSLTTEELLFLYDGPEITTLDRHRLHSAPRIWSQLHRYLVFADYIAALDGPTTKGYLANLVRHGQEHEAAHEMFDLLSDDCKERFARLTWEQIYTLVSPYWHCVPDLRQYLFAKPIGTRRGFERCFAIDTW